MTCGPCIPRPAIPQFFNASLYMTPVQKETGEFFSPLSLPREQVVVDSSGPRCLPIVSAMPSAPAVMPETPSKLSPTRQHLRPRSPLANGSAAGEFELRHWRTPKKRAPAPRWAPPPVIEIPHGTGSDDDSGSSSGGHGYTSLRDILSSPEYAAAAAGSPAAACVVGGGCDSCGDIHMIRHPLVKHAAYAYLQMTPSAREDPGRGRGRRWRGPLCRLLLGCLSFIGALFRP